MIRRTAALVALTAVLAGVGLASTATHADAGARIKGGEVTQSARI